jgi:sirohydrochlorin cobaltochelatase
VNHENLSDATLVLIGHGSTQNAESSAPVYQHAAELRRQNLFAEVREAFWKQEPKVVDVVKSVSTPRAFIVPLFVSDGYFSSDVIPRALGFSPGTSKLRIQNSELTYCRAVGTHRRMTDVLRARAREVVEQFPFPRAPRPKDTTLFIAGHGTEQNENSREAIERQVEWLRTGDDYADVLAIFLEEAPRIPECYTLARTKDVVVVPFFISDGMHTREDIPVLLGESKRLVQERLAAGRSTWRNPTERNGRRVWYAAAAGTDPRVAEVILDRVREAVN